MNQVNRDLRGHDFLPGIEALADLPDLYATEHVPLADKVIHLHYFIGSCHTVSDPSDYILLLLSRGGAEDVVVAEAGRAVAQWPRRRQQHLRGV
jgi:cell division FtsZ-interacting protein ZapD